MVVGSVFGNISDNIFFEALGFKNKRPLQMYDRISCYNRLLIEMILIF